MLSFLAQPVYVVHFASSMCSNVVREDVSKANKLKAKSSYHCQSLTSYRVPLLTLKAISMAYFGFDIFLL